MWICLSNYVRFFEIRGTWEPTSAAANSRYLASLRALGRGRTQG